MGVYSKETSAQKWKVVKANIICDFEMIILSQVLNLV